MIHPSQQKTETENNHYYFFGTSSSLRTAVVLLRWRSEHISLEKSWPTGTLITSSRRLAEEMDSCRRRFRVKKATTAATVTPAAATTTVVHRRRRRHCSIRHRGRRGSTGEGTFLRDQQASSFNSSSSSSSSSNSVDLTHRRRQQQFQRGKGRRNATTMAPKMRKTKMTMMTTKGCWTFRSYR